MAHGDTGGVVSCFDYLSGKSVTFCAHDYGKTWFCRQGRVIDWHRPVGQSHCHCAESMVVQRLDGLSSQVHGTRNTLPIDTLTARLLSGSHDVGVRSTPSIPRAAAERNIAPIFVVSTTPSITTIRRASPHISPTGTGLLRRMAHNTPRVSL